MKQGDLVVLSAKGKKLNMNWQIVEHASYGIITKMDYPNAPRIITVRWFGTEGTMLWGYKKPSNYYRHELKKFKKKCE